MGSGTIARARVAGCGASLSSESPNWREVIPKHVPALDGLRGIAILLVMTFHFLPGGLTGQMSNRWLIWLVKLLECGWIGVDVFFVLSGFLITGILLDAKSSDSHYFRNFYMRRVLRIFPLYFLTVAGVVALTGPDTVYQNDQVWLWMYKSNIIMSIRQEWFGIVSHFWSLAVEEHFYLVWPLLVFMLNRRALVGCCIALVASALALRIVLVLSGYKFVVPYTLTPCRMDGLLIGALIALFVRSPRGFKWLKILGPIAASVSACVLLRSLYVQKGLWIGDEVMVSVGYTLTSLISAGCLIIGIGWGADSWAARILACRGLRAVGKYSYAAYVFHMLIRACLLDPLLPSGRLIEAIRSPFLGGWHTSLWVVPFHSWLRGPVGTCWKNTYRCYAV